MIVSHSFEYVFVKTRKTAGTSLEIALSRFAGPSDVLTPDTEEDEKLKAEWGGVPAQNRVVPRARWGPKELVRSYLGRPPALFYNHMPAAEIRRLIGPTTWNSYFTFTIERNPWDLAVSAWSWYSTRKPMSFEAFLRSNKLRHYSNWRIYAIRGEVAVDWVIRYDQLSIVLPQLSDRLRLPETPILPRAKADARRDRRPYQDLYGEAERARVASVFKREIDAFGWTFE